MATKTQATPDLLLLLSLLSLTLVKTTVAHRCGIAIYWGQNVGEGNLTALCDTGRFAYVNIAFLDVFGNGQTPLINLDGHSNPATNGCTIFSEQIRFKFSVFEFVGALWTKSVKARLFFMGLVALPLPSGINAETDTIPSGFIPTDVLESQVLPVVKKTKKYGGVMLWNAFWDVQDGYSTAIMSSVV